MEMKWNAHIQHMRNVRSTKYVAVPVVQQFNDSTRPSTIISFFTFLYHRLLHVSVGVWKHLSLSFKYYSKFQNNIKYKSVITETYGLVLSSVENTWNRQTNDVSIRSIDQNEKWRKKKNTRTRAHGFNTSRYFGRLSPTKEQNKWENSLKY